MATLLAPGHPLAEARRQMNRSRQTVPLPTGEAVFAGASLPFSANPIWTSANTKGAWIATGPATTVDTYGLLLFNAAATNVAANDSSTVVDVGVGAASSEVVVIPDIAFGWRPNGYMENRFPIFIPRGSSISLRAAGAQTSGNVLVYVVPLARTPGQRPSTTVSTLNVSGSKGTTLDTTGISANTKTPWTQLIASTSERYTGLAVGIQGGADTVQPSAQGLVDIGIGAAGAETVIVPNLAVFTTTNENIAVIDEGPWLIDIPPGSRIAARYQASNTGMSLDVIVHGIR